tara:strand:+ start:344 stop:754 length:411 start_codon:yes stop_codon:yes gene_type:complete
MIHTKKSITKLKKELDNIFSKYIRLKYSVDGYVNCFTCGVKKSWNQMQAGHFMSRKYISTRWQEDPPNVMPQCVSCNIFKSGMQYEYGKRLDALFGVGTADEIQIKSREIVKLKKVDYIAMIEIYKLKVKKLIKEC